MRADLAALLRCPHCGQRLSPSGRTLRCAAGHAFDIARQGYVSLLPADARPAAADTAEMVEARAAFLAGGHYEPLREAIVARARAQLGDVEGCVADIGSGNGYYLAALIDSEPGRLGVALDSSKPALRRAARAHERIAAVACDAWEALPLMDGAAALALSVFSPRGVREIERVLTPGGALLTVLPDRSHLAELVEPLGLLSVEAAKRERLDHKLRRMELVDESRCEHSLPLSRADVRLLVGMGPSSRHIEQAVLEERIAALGEPVRATLAVTLLVHRRP